MSVVITIATTIVIGIGIVGIGCRIPTIIGRRIARG